jgi:hypothetical protein
VNIGDIRDRLMKLQNEVAVDAVEHPGEGSSFDYGRRVGTFNGVGLAYEAIETMYRDAEDKDESL